MDDRTDRQASESQIFSALTALVMAYKASLDDKIIATSWAEFKHPTKEMASNLLDAEAMMEASSGVTYSVAVESLRVKNRGNIHLRRFKDPDTAAFGYKLQLHCLIDGNGNKSDKTEEASVATSTVVTAVRAGVSILAMALALDRDFVGKIKARLFSAGDVAVLEAIEIDKVIGEAQAAARSTSHRI